MLLACYAASTASRVPRVPPPVEFLRTGTLSPNAPHLVRYVDEDAAGELRLVETSPIYPTRVS